jgi:thiol-disulfide isomerase/thioredoxin
MTGTGCIYKLKPKPGCFLMLLLISCSLLNAQHLNITLKSELIHDPPGRFTGITNLFFSPVDSTIQISFPKSWKNAEIDFLVRNSTVYPVPVLRTKDESGNFQYYIDLNNDREIKEPERLNFIPFETYKIADFTITPQPVKGASQRGAIKYQLILAEKYIYGRIHEQRTGSVDLNGKSYKIVIRPFTRNSVNFSKAESQIFIDLNLNSEISEKWQLKDELVVKGEEIYASDPFKVADQGYVIDSIDPGGKWLSLKPTSTTEALALNYKFPLHLLTDTSGISIRLNTSKYTLLELWSIACPHCESIRPALNKLKTDFDDKFDWITISRENYTAVKQFLEKHPMNSGMIGTSGELWNYLNPRIITPLFYLIDTAGSIIFKGSGANMLPVITALIKAKND